MTDQIKSEIRQRSGLLQIFLGTARMVADRTDDVRRLHGMNGMIDFVERQPQIIAPVAVQIFRTMAKTEPNGLLREYARMHIDTCQRLAPGIKPGLEIKHKPSIKRQAATLGRLIRRTEGRTYNLARRYMRRDLTQLKP